MPNISTILRALAAVAAAGVVAFSSCASDESAVLEKCKAETKVASCQTCCEKEGWQKGSTASGECECSKSEGTSF